MSVCLQGLICLKGSTVLIKFRLLVRKMILQYWPRNRIRVIESLNYR